MKTTVMLPNATSASIEHIPENATDNGNQDSFQCLRLRLNKKNNLPNEEKYEDKKETDHKPEENEDATNIPEYCRAIRITDSHGHVRELLFPKDLDLDRPKRIRTTFSSGQLNQLEIEFQRNHYLVGKERSLLAEKLGLSEIQVKVWFQNRRTKHKREKQREAEEKKSSAESVATCNVLRLLQERPPLPILPTISNRFIDIGRALSPSKPSTLHFYPS